MPRSDSSRGTGRACESGPAASVKDTATFSATEAAGTASRQIESGCRVLTTLHSAELQSPEFRKSGGQRSGRGSQRANHCLGKVSDTPALGSLHSSENGSARLNRKHSPGRTRNVPRGVRQIVVPERG